MRQRCVEAAILACLSVALLVGSQSAYAQSTERAIRVRGANAMASLCDAWAKDFSTANPGVGVVVAGGGTDAGFDTLFDKAADLVMASRTILVKEMQAAALSDAKPVELPVCREAIAVITHPDNPIKDLTLDQLGKILRGMYTRWNEVGGPEEPITLLTSPQTSGTSLLLRAAVMENDYFSSDAKARDYYHHIIREVSRKKPPAISYAPLRDAARAEQQKLIKIVPLRKDGQSPAVRPSPATLKDGSYPLILALYFYWDEATVRPIVKTFVEFCRKKCESPR
ncbi:MAG: substrate-binding domain-containing protein [Desulfomonile tiedjei]|nr:substrate-binding domain-containing protein [Desulfomonile tiedjei]